MKYLLSYGSLKSQGNTHNCYNFGRFSGQKFLKTLELDGYELYNLGSYPGILPGEGKITCELQELSDVAAKQIFRMELGAGYIEKKVNVDIDGKEIEASLYIYDDNDIKYSCKKVDSGNW